MICLIDSAPKVCFITGSRAEFGLLKLVMTELKNRAQCDLQLIVTGAHLSTDYGNTVEEILREGFVPDCSVENIVGGDLATDIAKSHGLATAGVAEALDNL